MQQKTFTRDSKELIPIPKSVENLSKRVDTVEFFQNAINSVIQNGINTLQGMKSIVERKKSLNAIMRERRAYEESEFQKNLDNFINKSTLLEESIDNFQKDKGEFRINGSPNWAFYTSPSSYYDFKQKKINDGVGSVQLIPSRNGGLQPSFCQKTGKIFKRVRCDPISYGNTPYGRVSEIRQLNVMMDELYSAIYSLELEKTNIGKNLHAFQPQKGSFIGNLTSQIGKSVERSLRNIDLF